MLSHNGWNACVPSRENNHGKQHRNHNHCQWQLPKQNATGRQPPNVAGPIADNFWEGPNQSKTFDYNTTLLKKWWTLWIQSPRIRCKTTTNHLSRLVGSKTSDTNKDKNISKIYQCSWETFLAIPLGKRWWNQSANQHDNNDLFLAQRCIQFVLPLRPLTPMLWPRKGAKDTNRNVQLH